MTNRLLLGLGWTICFAGFSTFVTTCQSSSQEYTEGMSGLTYALEADGLVRLQIDHPDEPLFLRVHLELPQDSQLQADETVVYGVNVTTNSLDGDSHSQDLWLRSRVSLDDVGEPTLIGPQSDRSVTDGRHLELDLKPLLGNGGQVAFSPLLNHPESRLLLRVERQPKALQMRLPWLGGAILSSRTARFTALPWTSLTREEIQRIWADNRRPLSAVALKGDTVTLIRRGEVTPSPLARIEPTRLSPGQSTTMTLQGPCSLTVSAQSLVENEGVPADWMPTVERIQGRAPNGEDRISASAIEVPTGSLWSVHWTAPEDRSGLELSFLADSGKACVWGQLTGSVWEKDLAPETRRFTAWSLETAEELLVPVASGSGRGVLVVEARPHYPSDWVPDPSPSAPLNTILRYQFEDQAGNVMGTGRAAVEQTTEPYDRRIEPHTGWMGKVTRLSLQHPPQATQIRFQTEGALDLRFLVPIPVEEERGAVYALPSGWTAQNAPWNLAPYVSLTPLQSDALLDNQRLVRFDATVKPRKVLRSRPEGAQDTRVLIPEGQRLRHGVLEAVRRPGAWRSWHRTALSRTTRVNVPETGILRVDYRTNAVEPGEFQLNCDGQEFVQPLNAGAGTLRLSGLKPNWNLCRLSAPSGEYVVDAPGSGRRMARRGLYRLTDRLKVEVDVPIGGTTVFVRAYTKTGVRASPVTLKVDGGRPRIRSGSVRFPTTPIQRRTPQPVERSAQLIDQERGQLQAHKGLFITLGDDLIPGKHTVEVSLPEGADPIFVRFDSSAAPLSETNTLRHWYVDGGAP